MSNYTKIVDFAAKDALLTGNPAKVAKGTEIGAELDAIATAITSKQDANDVNLVFDDETASISNTWTWSVPAVFAVGSNSAPSLTFDGDSNTGIYRVSADTVGIATAGTLRLSVGDSTLTYNSNTIWHAGNDGASSTLDADKLDGQEGTYYLDYTNHTNTPPMIYKAYKTADTSRNTTTTLTADNHLQIANVPAGRYEIRAILYPTSDGSTAGGGFKSRISATSIDNWASGGQGGVWGHAHKYDGGGHGYESKLWDFSDWVFVHTQLGGPAIAAYGFFLGEIGLTATSTVQLDWAQYVSDADNTNLCKGSYLILTKLS